MRNYIDILNQALLNEDQALVEEALIWELSGLWIDEFGKTEYTDHEQGIHHADIAMNNFDIEPNDEGEYDEYCREAALDAAFDNGWVRISTNGTKEIGLEWAGEISKATQRGLIQFLLDDPTTYESYVITVHRSTTGFKKFEDLKSLINALRVLFR